MSKNKEQNSEIISITEIKLKLSDKKEIALTSEEARKVYEELGKLFNLENIPSKKLDDAIEELKRKFPQPNYYPIYQPIIIERRPSYPVYPQWVFWCTTTNATSLQDTVNKTSFGAPETSVLFINLTNQTV